MLGKKMSLKTKINERLQDSSTWILNTPESLVILLLMGTGIGGLAFGSFSLAMGFSKHWFFMVFFGVFSFMSIKKFISIFKMVKRTSLKDALGGFTAREFVWKKDKDGNKLYGGVEDGGISGYEGNEMGSNRNAEKNKRIREEIGHIYRQSERPSENDSNKLSDVEINSKSS